MMREEDIRKRVALDTYLKLVEEECLLSFYDKDNLVVVDCPACSGNSYTLEFNKNGFDYVTCSDCDTLYARTRTTLESLKRFYDTSDSTRYWINQFFKPVMEARREKIFRPRAEEIAKRFGNDPQWFIGDIGAGFGLFLEELRKLWPASRYLAIEPSSEQADICRSLDLETEECLMEDLKGYEGQFDILTAFELMEHLNNPRAFLDVARRLLREGGLLLMTMLNGQGFDIQILWERSKNIYPPSHINFFNPDSIRFLLEKEGFVIEELTTPGQLDWDIVEGAIKNGDLRSNRFWRLLEEKGTADAKSEFQEWIRKYCLSSHMRVLAIK